MRVTVDRLGGRGVEWGRGTERRPSCATTLIYLPERDALLSSGPRGRVDFEHSRLAAVLCDARFAGWVWIEPDDGVDADGDEDAARAEAERYVEEVLRPAVSIGANPAAKGLVGLPSWFWVEGFTGQLTAPPITAFGMTIEVRMATGSVTWDFGDGTVVDGDLGLAYPEESTVQHAYQRAGTYTVTASLELVPEYRVDGGPWMPLPSLTAAASADHPVEERQAVITHR